MMALVHLFLFARIEVVHSDPGVIGRSNNEPVSEERVEGGGGRGVGQGDRDRWVLSTGFHEHSAGLQRRRRTSGHQGNGPSSRR